MSSCDSMTGKPGGQDVLLWMTLLERDSPACSVQCVCCAVHVIHHRGLHHTQGGKSFNRNILIE